MIIHERSFIEEDYFPDENEFVHFGSYGTMNIAGEEYCCNNDNSDLKSEIKKDCSDALEELEFDDPVHDEMYVPDNPVIDELTYNAIKQARGINNKKSKFKGFKLGLGVGDITYRFNSNIILSLDKYNFRHNLDLPTYLSKLHDSFLFVITKSAVNINSSIVNTFVKSLIQFQKDFGVFNSQIDGILSNNSLSALEKYNLLTNDFFKLNGFQVHFDFEASDFENRMNYDLIKDACRLVKIGDNSFLPFSIRNISKKGTSEEGLYRITIHYYDYFSTIGDYTIDLKHGALNESIYQMVIRNNNYFAAYLYYILTDVHKAYSGFSSLLSIVHMFMNYELNIDDNPLLFVIIYKSIYLFTTSS